MSRDVAYRNGYLPLYAGAELVRRSGSLTQFPAENLIGTLPVPPDCTAFVAYDTPRPAVPEDGVAILALSVYPYIETTYRDALEADPNLCAQVVEAFEQLGDIAGGALPIVPEGTPFPDLSDPTGWRITPDTPGVAGAIGFNTGYVQGGVFIPSGIIIVNISALGVVTVDLSSFGPVPATFSAAGMQSFNVGLSVTASADGTWWPYFDARLTPSPTEWVQCLNGGACIEPTFMLWRDEFIGSGELLSAHAPNVPSGGVYESSQENTIVQDGYQQTTVGTFTYNLTSPVAGGEHSIWELRIPRPLCADSNTCDAGDDFYLDITDADGNVIADNGFSAYISGAGGNWNVLLDGTENYVMPIPEGETRLQVEANAGVLNIRVLDGLSVSYDHITTCAVQGPGSLQRGYFGARASKASQLRGRTL